MNIQNWKINPLRTMVSRSLLILVKERDYTAVINIGKTVTKTKDIQVKDIDSRNPIKAQITFKNNTSSKNI